MLVKSYRVLGILACAAFATAAIGGWKGPDFSGGGGGGRRTGDWFFLFQLARGQMMALHLICTLNVLAASEPAAASGNDSGGFGMLFQHLIAAVLFSAMGLLVFGGALWLANRLAPFSLRKEMEEDQNTAVAIIIGAIMIGISIIIAAAIHG